MNYKVDIVDLFDLDDWVSRLGRIVNGLVN